MGGGDILKWLSIGRPGGSGRGCVLGWLECICTAFVIGRMQSTVAGVEATGRIGRQHPEMWSCGISSLLAAALPSPFLPPVAGSGMEALVELVICTLPPPPPAADRCHAKRLRAKCVRGLLEAQVCLPG